MIENRAPLPPLPLVLWEVPPGLELALGQEGVPFTVVREPNPLALLAGRHVLYDGKKVSSGRLRSMLTPGHVAIDVDLFRRGEAIDPFRALVDDLPAPGVWELENLSVVERISRHPKARIRTRLVERLRRMILDAGGIWARLAPFPFPYRSAFNLRIDLDEPAPDDYRRFAQARRAIDDATTHFLCTDAYQHLPSVIADLKGLDVQSHGHYHFVYRDPEANRRNVARAREVLRELGFEPEGFAGPHGRWNVGLDRALEAERIRYSSDFQLGYDDRPFFPWRGDGFSPVLQVPVHPICEGAILEAGGDAEAVANHLVRAVQAKVDAGEPAFVYGHPERRLGRHPEIVGRLAAEVARLSLVWRVTLTEFARWWRWRAAQRFTVVSRGEQRFEVQFDDWEGLYPLGLEVVRGRHVALIPLQGPMTSFELGALVYERRSDRVDLPTPTVGRKRGGIKAAVRSALDWETVTPVSELPSDSFSGLLKRELRRWKQKERIRQD